MKNLLTSLTLTLILWLGSLNFETGNLFAQFGCNEQTSSTTKQLNSVYFTDVNIVSAVAIYGTIL